MSFIINRAYSQQQDVDFHINAHLFAGKKILKVKRDFRDPYLWVLAKNNEVYRVNSITLAVDNYTGKFGGFSSDTIIDIAGYNQDTLWAATRSKIINCYKGIVQLSSMTSSIAYRINSIGMSNFGYGGEYYGLAIGTDSTAYSYDLYSKQFLNYNYIGRTQIFEATYRRFIRSDYNYAFEYDTTKSIPVLMMANEGYSTAIWKGGPFGQWPNTAFYSTTGFNEIGFNANLYWGTDNGFFEIWNDYNDFNGGNFNHYLAGIKINKITDIYGLTNFSRVDIHNHLFTKENLLIGSDNGFYFTNSIYYDGNSGPNELNVINLFHYNPLGNVPVNDICVNSTVTMMLGVPAGCENGVWLGTNDGLYFLTPDYGKYLDPNDQISALYVNLPGGDTISHLPICSGSSVSLLINPYTINNNTIQWVKNGQDIAGQTGNQLAVSDSGDYNAILYDPCSNVHIETNHLKVSLIAGPAFTFNYPDTILYCDSSQTTLKTTYSPSYHYQWYTNGVLNGDTTSSFVVTQTGKYKVEVSACTNSWVPSKEVQVNLSSVPEPGISIDKIPYCYGDTAHFTSTWLMDTTAYTLRWYKDNTLLTGLNNQQTIKTVIPGTYTLSITDNKTLCAKVSPPYQLSFTPPPSFTFNYPAVINYCQGSPVTLTAQGDPNYQYRWYKDGTLTGDVTAALAITQAGKYKVEVSACTNSWVPSKEIQVNFITLPLPVITTDKPSYCIGDNATLSIAAPVDPGYTINWYKDNVLFPSGINQNTLTTNVAGNYTVSIVSNTVNTDGSICSQASGGYSLSFNPPPTVSIEKIVNTTICDGQTIGLLAHYNGGTVKWSTGETTDEISVTTPGNYRATVSSAAGCIADTSITIAFLPNPVFSINDTSVCTYKKQVITITAPSGFAQYAWNGTPGGQTYEVSQPQTVSLTVTDVNGCQASQQIKVAEHCPDVYIPNAFTPNGDGINDTWVIEGLDNDATASVKVFTRYGNLIFESKGYGTPWNGEYNGKKLPAAVYYYIVTAKNGAQKFSGSITIIY